MSSTVMLHNGRGWETGGKVAHENVGHPSDGYTIDAGAYGRVNFTPGETFTAMSKREKTAINAGLLRAGWLAHTLADCLVHGSTGAVLRIERNYWVDLDELPGDWVDGDPTRAKVRAGYTCS